MKGSWYCAGSERNWCASHQQPLHGTRRSILWAGWSHCPGHASGCLSTPFYPPYLVRRGPFFGQTGCIAQYTLLAASDRAAAGLEHSIWGTERRSGGGVQALHLGGERGKATEWGSFVLDVQKGGHNQEPLHPPPSAGPPTVTHPGCSPSAGTALLFPFSLPPLPYLLPHNHTPGLLSKEDHCAIKKGHRSRHA